MKDNRISIIVPVYNSEKYLDRCIESLKAQTYSNFEVILVNDGSTDTSGIICDNYSKKDSRFKVIHKKNGGVSSARNTGLDIATGDFILFLDSDDTINKEMLETMINAYEDNAQVIVGFKYYNKNVTFPNVSTNLIGALRILHTTKGSDIGFCCHRLFVRKLIGNLRFNTKISFAEDNLFWLNYASKLDKFIFKSYIGHNYIYNNNQISLTRKKVNYKDTIYVLDSLTTASCILASQKGTEVSNFLSTYMISKYIQFTNRILMFNISQTDFSSYIKELLPIIEKNKAICSPDLSKLTAIKRISFFLLTRQYNNLYALSYKMGRSAKMLYLKLKR